MTPRPPSPRRLPLLERCQRAVAPLHRRIFGWFAVAIVTSVLAGALVSHLFGRGSRDWSRTVRGTQTFLTHRFEEVWQDPQRREALASDLERELAVDVTLRDELGAVTYAAARPCERPDFTLSIKGDPGGQVLLCTHTKPNPMAGLLGLFVAVLILWVTSHRVSRWLSRPLHALVLATDAIGRGNYDVKLYPGRHAPVEIVRLGTAVEVMGRRIKKQMADQRELLASVSHELRSPLARIRLLLEFIRDTETPRERAEKLVDDIEQETIELDELVGGLLAQSRIDFSALTRRPHDVVQLFEKELRRARSSAKLSILGSPRMWDCDATLMTRAFANLIDNAEKHGGGATFAELHFKEHELVISVGDLGPGLIEGEEAKIFERFYGNSKGEHESIGLGLSIVRRIALAHGGSAFAQNRAGGGATIGLSIDEGSTGPSESGAAESGPSGSGPSESAPADDASVA